MKTPAPLRPFPFVGLQPWTPHRLENRLRRLFGPEFLSEFLPEEAFAWAPEIDLMDVNGELVLTAELPGMKLEDVTIEVMDDVLTLRGDKKQEEKYREGSYQICERSYGAFERSFTLPRSVDVEKIRADFENGILTVHLPKLEEAKGRKIQIEVK
jgi:HSP20 family protein